MFWHNTLFYSLLKQIACIILPFFPKTRVSINKLNIYFTWTYQETVDVLWPSNQHGEVPKLFRQSEENLIFIIDGVLGKKLNRLVHSLDFKGKYVISQNGINL